MSLSNEAENSIEGIRHDKDLAPKMLTSVMWEAHVNLAKTIIDIVDKASWIDVKR